MSKAQHIAVVRLPKDHPALKDHKPGDMFEMGARVPTLEENEGSQSNEGPEDDDEIPAQADKGHVTLHVHSVNKAGGSAPAGKKPMKGGAMEYLKSKQK